MKTPLAVAAIVMIALGAAAVEAAAPDGTALVPAGPPATFFVAVGSAVPGSAAEVPAFRIDRRPVTRRQYAEFVRRHLEWQRSRVPPVLADAHYLEDWASDVDAGTRVPLDAPVTRVSWFAANAYCRSKGKDLPTVEQWERAAAGSEKDSAAMRERILQWYSRPGSERLGTVGRGTPNVYGIHDLHGLIWEWTLDFNSTLVSTESRDPGGKDDPLFCGSGSLGAVDPSDYATFMRYALRNSLRANYTTSSLGFRCATEAAEQ